MKLALCGKSVHKFQKQRCLSKDATIVR